MESLMIVVNFLTMGIIFFWAFYHHHVTESLFLRLAYLLMCFSSAIILISSVLPIDGAFYHRNYLWQRVLFSVSIAIYCIADFAREYGTERYIQAFKNNKEFAHHKKNLTLTKH